jgi:hypothetical protein
LAIAFYFPIVLRDRLNLKLNTIKYSKVRWKNLIKGYCRKNYRRSPCFGTGANMAFQQYRQENKC